MVSILGWIEAHPGTAGWVQAIGAIIALFVAVAVPIWQRRAEASELKKRRIEAIQEEAYDYWNIQLKRVNALKSIATEVFNRFQQVAPLYRGSSALKQRAAALDEILVADLLNRMAELENVEGQGEVDRFIMLLRAALIDAYAKASTADLSAASGEEERLAIENVKTLISQIAALMTRTAEQREHFSKSN